MRIEAIVKLDVVGCCRHRSRKRDGGRNGVTIYRRGEVDDIRVGAALIIAWLQAHKEIESKPVLIGIGGCEFGKVGPLALARFRVPQLEMAVTALDQADSHVVAFTKVGATDIDILSLRGIIANAIAETQTRLC